MATDPNRIASYSELLELLAREGVLHQARTEEKSVTIPTEKGSLDGMLLMRWQDSDGIIQFIQSMPLEIPADKVALVESAIARLNHALALPGFDLNHEYRLLTYRQVLPIYPRGYVHPAEIQAMFRVTVKTASDFLPTLARVLRGEGTLANIVADAQRDAEAAAAAPPPPAAAEPVAAPAAPAAAPAEPSPAGAAVPGALGTY
jgi:hypothetical protein